MSVGFALVEDFESNVEARRTHRFLLSSSLLSVVDFQNYVQYGMDFLISGKSHKVIKIVLHSNLPGAIQFGRFERCPWEFEGDERSGTFFDLSSFRSTDD